MHHNGMSYSCHGKQHVSVLASPHLHMGTGCARYSLDKYRASLNFFVILDCFAIGFVLESSDKKMQRK